MTRKSGSTAMASVKSADVLKGAFGLLCVSMVTSMPSALAIGSASFNDSIRNFWFWLINLDIGNNDYLWIIIYTE